MTPEKYAEEVLSRMTMTARIAWYADVLVVEWDVVVDSDEFKRLIAEAIRYAIAGEREMCAELVDWFPLPEGCLVSAGDLIRART